MIDSSEIKKLLSLSDNELRKTVSDAALAAGADKYVTANLLSDVKRLRTMLESLTTEQMNAIIENIGEQTAEEIKRRINETRL
ncbi:MAG: hypothetical protein J5844_04055 [Clostridia bacterium]|nr:hypothetical protein [Clostridia bacterium]